jgi:probable HAF family extracellular repeat protein
MSVIHSVHKAIVSLQFPLAAAAVCCLLGQSAHATQTPQYRLVDLGLVGAGQPYAISDNGIVAGGAQGKAGTEQATVYFNAIAVNVAKPGLGGPNGEAIGANLWNEVVGAANTAKADPHGEDFCGFQSLGVSSAKGSCLPFLLKDGQIMALQTLDGNLGANGVANAINNLGIIAGSVENATLETTCPTYDPTKLQYQRYQFKPVLWRPQGLERLSTIAGDPVGTAVGINDKGQSVGSTGTCATFSFFGSPMQPLHAVLWQANGAPIDLKSLGGTAKSVWGNHAQGLNSLGHVVGGSSLSDNQTLHAFFWTKEAGEMQDLGSLPGLPNSFAVAINDNDVIVGVSTDFQTQFTGTLWKGGQATDLNTLVPANSPLYIVSGCSINSRGEIVGLAVDDSGNFHAYEMIPTSTPQP